MLLHEDKQAFSDAILAVGRALKIAPSIVEKDYYVTLILKNVNQKIPGLLFKGGTSLSKCYKIIDRFSEDIDLTLDDRHFTQSQKRNANKIMIDVCDKLGLEIANRETVEKHGHGNYNKYSIEYPILFPSDDIKPVVEAEMVFMLKAYPYEERQADSLIGSWLIENGNPDAAARYGLLPFPVQVQTLERTFVDKVFAICDYYLQNEPIRNSRHIYDVFRILTKVRLTEELKPFIETVREERKHDKKCLSAMSGMSVTDLLRKIIETDFYKKDYINNTEKLLIHPVAYDESIVAVKKIADCGLFE